MPSVTYMNQSAPFWDFVASLEQDGRNHPFFSQNHDHDHNERGEGHQHHGPTHFGPWGWGFPGFGSRDIPHRGPPPPEQPVNEEDQQTEKDNDNGEGPSNNSASDSEGCGRGKGRHGRCGRRHGFGPHGMHGPQGHHRHHGFRGRGGFNHGGRRGGWGGPMRGQFNPFNFAAGMFDPSANNNGDNKDVDSGDFAPEADVFDTPSSFIIHISLPGAKKEDVGVNWDAEKSELAVAGVIYRPGDEELLKTLAMDERKVGPFERKIRLGTRATPAQIDAEGINAKLEDGILRVEVPKLETGFVEIKKVDVE